MEEIVRSHSVGTKSSSTWDEIECRKGSVKIIFAPLSLQTCLPSSLLFCVTLQDFFLLKHKLPCVFFSFCLVLQKVALSSKLPSDPWGDVPSLLKHCGSQRVNGGWQSVGSVCEFVLPSSQRC